jgi:putative transcriptional regulator
MSPLHHPGEDLLVDYATGALFGGRRLVVEAHLEACPQCRAAVAQAEAVGGLLLQSLPAAALQPHALDWALARIERPAPAPEPPKRQAADWIAVPETVVEAARRHRRWAAPGVWVAPVTRGPGRARSYLLGVGAGISVPRHTHRGLELTCVLKGAYRDGDGLYEAGDFACHDEHVEHRPTVTADGECVCLIAADRPLVPRDWVGRLFQPLVRI